MEVTKPKNEGYPTRSSPRVWSERVWCEIVENMSSKPPLFEGRLPTPKREGAKRHPSRSPILRPFRFSFLLGNDGMRACAPELLSWLVMKGDDRHGERRKSPCR